MEFIEDGLVPIIAILSTIALPIGFGMYLTLSSNRAKHKENMELIKQGIVPLPKAKPKVTPNRYRSLRNGVLCIGIGLGLVIGLVASELLGIGGESPAIMVIVGAPVLICLGLAYVLFFAITKDQNFDEYKDLASEE